MFQVSIPVVRASSVKEAIGLIAGGARPLAGGTDILVQAKEGMIPGVRSLVDVSNIAELRGIEVTAKKVIIGAAASLGEICEHAVIRSDFPALVMAGSWFASPQIRNRATLTGNIANASPAGDSLPALYAYDAAVQLRSKSGRRVVPLKDFITGVRTTLLAPDEMITGIVLPRGKGDHVGSFIKIGQRKALAISKVMIAVSATLSARGVVRNIGIALGAVAPVIIRLGEAEEMLTGNRITPELAGAARALAEKAVQPIDDIRSTAAYRRKVAGVVTERALLRLSRLDA